MLLFQGDGFVYAGQLSFSFSVVRARDFYALGIRSTSHFTLCSITSKTLLVSVVINLNIPFLLWCKRCIGVERV